MSDVPFRLEASSFTRLANATPYASGQLVADSASAGTVSKLSWNLHRSPSGSVRINRAKIKKSGTSVTNASFRLHLYATSPTPANPDGGVWSTTESGYLGFIDIVVDKAFSDGAAGHGVPVYTNVCQIDVRLPGTSDLPAGKKIYGLLEARGAYTPASGEVFTVYLEIEPQ